MGATRPEPGVVELRRGALVAKNGRRPSGARRRARHRPRRAVSCPRRRASTSNVTAAPDNKARWNSSLRNPLRRGARSVRGRQCGWMPGRLAVARRQSRLGPRGGNEALVARREPARSAPMPGPHSDPRGRGVGRRYHLPGKLRRARSLTKLVGVRRAMAANGRLHTGRDEMPGLVEATRNAHPAIYSHAGRRRQVYVCAIHELRPAHEARRGWRSMSDSSECVDVTPNCVA